MRSTGPIKHRAFDRRFNSLPIRQWILALVFSVFVSACATVDSTIGKVTSVVSGKSNKTDSADSPEAGVPASNQLLDAEASAPVKKPLLVEVQEKLRTLGYYSGPISGRLDSRSEAAIQDFQLDKDLRIDGRPTSTLLEEIDKALQLL